MNILNLKIISEKGNSHFEVALLEKADLTNYTFFKRIDELDSLEDEKFQKSIIRDAIKHAIEHRRIEPKFFETCQWSIRWLDNLNLIFPIKKLLKEALNEIEIDAENLTAQWQEEKYLSASEIAERLGVRKARVLTWCRDGRFPNATSEATKFFKVWIVPESDLKDFKLPKRGGSKVSVGTKTNTEYQRARRLRLRKGEK